MNETVKRKLINLLQENHHVEEQGLNKTANNVDNLQEAILIIPRYKSIIKTQNKHFFDDDDQSRSTICFVLSELRTFPRVENFP